ncbi:ABC transporter permease [Haladaptatus sp. F3-133]|mgnify:CR=1 FL=1|uniref:ABC transporter permease n=1 Tax=Halorutilus salinus TaxID=2487751 RepID=A0A9Q4C3C1_9EURY|nr:ABC transporter permease [Halorutilus salinus]
MRGSFRSSLDLLYDKLSGVSAGALVVPFVVFETVLFLGAGVYLLRVSLAEPTALSAFEEGTWTVSNYLDVMTDEYLMGRLSYSIRLGAVVTAVTVPLGFVYAYAAWRAEGRRKITLLSGVLVALLISIVIKVYAWVILLSPEGVINRLLVGTVTDSPVSLLGNSFGVVVGLVYSMLPYVVLTVYSVLATLDERSIEAARDLGAGRLRSVYEVVLPGAAPGVIAASVVCFSWSSVAYAAPVFLGSPSERTVAVEVGRLFTQSFDWSHAAALGVISMVAILSTAGAGTLTYTAWRRYM